MGFSEYLVARESLALFGQPVMTYILIIALLQGLFSILSLRRNSDTYYNYLIKFLSISAGLYILGFLLLIRFHVQIYNNVVIEYPVILRQVIPVESSRFVIPLWIETEKLYFWVMTASLFVLMMQKKKDIVSFLGMLLAILSVMVYFLSNPFQQPLPVVHSEITAWYAALAAGDASILQLAGTLYGRITFYYNSTYMWVHPPMLFIAYASLVITFAACIHMILQREKLHDRIAYRYAKIGYVLLTAGMLIGYPWAIEAWKDSAWWWDPKINGSIMMWVLYTAYLHSHIYVDRGAMWNRTAYLGIICFASLVFTYLLTYLVPGIHSVVQP